MKNEPLYELINSLNMSEKRFFKIFSQRHVIGEVNQYLQLFDYIDKNYPNHLSNIDKQPFVKNISAEKNYLYRLILKSLNAYYFDFSYKMKIQNLIISSEILAYKGLDNQALKVLDKAEKLATEAELYALILTIKQTEFEILSKLSKYQEAELILEKNNEVIPKITQLNRIQAKTTELYKLRQNSGGIRTEEEFSKFNSLAKDDFNQIDSVKSLLFQTSLNITLSHALKDYSKELEHLKSIIDLYEKHPFLIEYSVKGYVSSIYNLANTYRNLKDYDNALQVLNRLDKVRSNKIISTSKQISAFTFYLSNNLRLYIYTIQNDFDNALKHIEAIKNDYHLHENNIEKTVIYEHLILVIRILLEHKNFKQALKYSNIIINDTSYNKREDILSFIRLLNLVIHFELQNDLIIDSLSYSATNYLRKRKRLFKTEKEVINFIQKYHVVDKKYLLKINENLIKLKNDSFEKSMFNLFDFQKWVESKL